MINKATAGIIALSLFAGIAYAADPPDFSSPLQPADQPTVDKFSFPIEDGKYVKEPFQFNRSTGVGIATNNGTSAIAVATVHSDGRYHFGGSSEGGAVTNCEDTPIDPKTDKVVANPTSETDGCAGNGGS